jgi:aryl-alcohol dehydrogenase-like predicted oxidoreductase
MLHREPEPDVLNECERLGLGFLPFFPLESGLLTGKIRAGQAVPEGTRLSNAETQQRFVNDARLATVEKLIAYAEGKGHTILELAFSWLLAKPAVASVIAGATKPDQIYANAAAPTWKLSAAELAEIDTLLA